MFLFFTSLKLCGKKSHGVEKNLMVFEWISLSIAVGVYGCVKVLPSGKLAIGKSPFLVCKSTISMAIFNSKLLVYQIYT